MNSNVKTDPSGSESKGKKNRVQKLESAILDYGEFRYNEITKRPEILINGNWDPMNDFILNTIVRELKHKGIKGASKVAVADSLASDFVRKSNPIREYFNSLTAPDGNPIAALCRTVYLIDETKQELFEKVFTRWLIGCVANIFIKDRCANQLCFIIAGAQGTFKSTWIANLCPDALKGYYIEGGLDPDNKDCLLATASNWLWNMDDYFAGVTSKKINELKGFITKNTVKVRSPFGRYEEVHQKIVSFIGSSNEATFLHDPTGNRRFLPFEVESIDIDSAKAIDINSVWAQAHALFKSGHQYWLTKEEQRAMTEYMAQFEVQTMEYETLTNHFKMPSDETGEVVEYLKSTEILSYLKDHTGLRLTQKKVGEALRKAGFEMAWKVGDNDKRGRFWTVVKVDRSLGPQGKL